MTKPADKLKKSRTSRFVLGRARFATISAVEGISLTPSMVARAAQFDRGALTAAERRKETMSVYRKK